MAFLSRSNVTKTELATSIIGSVDIGNLLAQSLTLADDINRSKSVIDRMNAFATSFVPKANAKALDYAKYDGLKLINFAKQYLPAFLNSANTSIRDQVIQSAGGYRITSSMIGQETKLVSALNELDLFASVLIDIPESYAKDKVVKYLNKTLAPNKPTETDQMILAKNGKLTYTDYATWLQENLGLSATDASYVVDIRAQQIGKPDLHSYWLMARKGLITNTEWNLKAKLGHGFTQSEADALYKSFYYTFSPMELFRISDLMPTSSIWINKKLTDIGLADDDKVVIAALIQARTLKDEVNQAWNIMLDNYSWGLQTETDLTAFLTENNVPDVQAKAKLIIANMLKEKVILKLMRDAEIYQYRKDVLNENQLLANLQALTIEKDVANAITRNEAAKKGIDWELPP